MADIKDGVFVGERAIVIINSFGLWRSDAQGEYLIKKIKFYGGCVDSYYYACSVYVQKFGDKRFPDIDLLFLLQQFYSRLVEQGKTFVFFNRANANHEELQRAVVITATVALEMYAESLKTDPVAAAKMMKFGKALIASASSIKD